MTSRVMSMGDSQFSNIKNAIGMDAGDADTGGTLTPAEKVQNYDFFSREIMGKNVYLPDLVKQVEDLKKEVADLKANAKSEVDTELFEVMESKVKDVPDVKDARHALSEVKTQIINEMCQRDPRYQDAYTAYRRAVSKAYTSGEAKGASDDRPCIRASRSSRRRSARASTRTTRGCGWTPTTRWTRTATPRSARPGAERGGRA